MAVKGKIKDRVLLMSRPGSCDGAHLYCSGALSPEVKGADWDSSLEFCHAYFLIKGHYV